MIISVKDQNQLVKTDTFPYAHFKFETFNPVQSRVFEAYDKDCNYVVSAPTSVGKTVCAELFLSHEIRKNKKKGLYLSPFRALSQERIDDWKEEHHFSDLNLAICTGDYKLNASRNKEMEDADLIVMTTEILNSKARNYKPENDPFLREISCLCVDEVHLIAEEGRGMHVESALMQFTKINPDARIILLSATIPNSKQLGEWIESLNKKQTYVLQSEYRPVPLTVHYQKYANYGWGYNENEESKVDSAIQIVENYPKDKFILFVHTKKTGEMLFSRLKQMKIKCEYHNADLDKAKRIKVEKEFREDPNLKLLVSTSTMAAGVNLPARRIVVLGDRRGLSEVSARECKQMFGRAGRMGLDDIGDAYMLLPIKDFDKKKERIEQIEEVKSQLCGSKNLAFHIVSEICHGHIATTEDIHEWYKRSLAYWQYQFLENEDIDEITSSLVKCGAIIENGEYYEITKIGVVSSMFYYSPFDVSDLYRNWNRIFKNKKENDDYEIAMALSNLDSFRCTIVSKADREEIEEFKKHTIGEFTEGALKIGCCYHALLTGHTIPIFTGLMRGLLSDMDRNIEVLCALDKIASNWQQSGYFKRLNLRLLYGVDNEKVDICRLSGIGKIKSQKLWNANLRDLKTISENYLKVMKALNCNENVAQNIAQNAKELLYSI